MNLLEVSGLSKFFNDNIGIFSTSQFKAVENISFVLARKKHWLLSVKMAPENQLLPK